MAEDNEYILGTDPVELRRLRFQHQAWLQQALSLWQRAGFGAGASVLDLGCGPGFTALELAHIVGPRGRVIARDQSPGFLAQLEQARAQAGLSWIEPSLGTAEDLDLAPGSLDGAYSRWLLCWLPDAGRAIERVAAALRPGGCFAIHEYLDWAAMKMIPRSAAFERGVEACMASWHAGGATIDLCERLPELAARAGLVLEHFAPIARIGGVGSLEWRWVGEFYGTYLPRLIPRGLFTEAHLAVFLDEWQARSAAGDSYILAPLMGEAILRK